MAHSSWGPGWPNCQPGQIKSDFQVSGTRFPGGIRHELVDLATMLIQECKNRGYQFGTDSDPSYGCWGYSCRSISGTNTPSNHSWGLALDINAPSNPYTSPLVTDMPPWMPDLWNEYGWRWGGDYSGSKDAMHYEFMGSVTDAANQTSRARANGLGGSGSGGGGSTPEPEPEDWFDMATKDELKAVVDERLGFYLPRMLNVMHDGNGNQAFNPDSHNTIMLGSGGIARYGLTKINAIRYNTVDSNGKETAHDGDLAEAVGSATTAANRINYRTSKKPAFIAFVEDAASAAIFECDIIGRTYATVPNTTILSARKSVLDKAGVPWMNWPEEVSDMSGFGAKVPWTETEG